MRKQQAKIKNESTARRYRRKLSIRNTLSGTGDRPRVTVNRSAKNLFVQVVDDETSKTLFSVQTFGKNAVGSGSNKESGKNVGNKVADLLKEKKIAAVVFDRNGYRYHGVVASIADGIRENGIQL